MFSPIRVQPNVPTLLQTASGQASTLRILAQPSWKLNGFSASYFLDSPNATSPKAFPLHHSFLDEPSSSQPPLVGFSSIMTSFTAYSNMFHILAIALFALLVDVTFAQTLISSTLPACAQQCPVLIQAQGGCVPPAAPVTNQGIYQSCFCQSTFLQPLYGGPTPLCPSCPPADMTTIQNWFQGLCKPGAPQGGQQPAPTTTTPSTTISATAAATSSAGLTGVNETATPSGPQPGWYENHPKLLSHKANLPLIQDVNPLALGSNANRPLHRPLPRRPRLLAPPPPLPPPQSRPRNHPGSHPARFRGLGPRPERARLWRRRGSGQ